MELPVLSLNLHTYQQPPRHNPWETVRAHEFKRNGCPLHIKHFQLIFNDHFFPMVSDHFGLLAHFELS